MRVIPVLDVRNGQAVHARGGDRARYSVVDGALGSGADPAALATAFRDRLGCRELYLADLDAIGGHGDPRPLIQALAALGLRVRVDAGVRTPERAEPLLAAGAAQVVVGLETLGRIDELGAIVSAVGADSVVFSLDLRGGRPVTAVPELAAAEPLVLARAAVEQGVQNLVVLDLARVGAATGAPNTLLRQIRAELPDLQLFAGGGVRDTDDLAKLTALGCAGALVATALHSGRITRAELDRLRGDSAAD